MNKKAKTTIWLSVFLALVILSSSIYFMIPNKVRIDIKETRSKFSVWEDGSWVLSATEYLYLYDGSAKMRAKSRELNWFTEGDITTAIRIANYKDNITTIQTYKFDATTTEVELFPIYESAQCFNCEGKIVQFEYRDILYTGETKVIESPFAFGHNMKIEWEDGAYYSKVFQQKVASDKIIVKYRPDSDYVSFDVRLFDPAPSPNITFINCTSNPEGDTAEPYNTTGDRTPTFALTTDVNSSIEVSNDNSTWYDVSNTNLTSHIITVPVAAILDPLTDVLFVRTNRTDETENISYFEWNIEINDADAVVSSWNTALTSSGSSNSSQIKLPLISGGIYNFKVYWGDGNSDDITVYNQAEVTHDYDTEGIYSLVFDGELIGWAFSNTGDKLKLLDISQWGNMRVGNTGKYFDGCNNFNSTATDNLDLTYTTNLKQMFGTCTVFDGDISGWNTSGVTDISYMFTGANNFNSNISGWDVSDVTTMQSTFYNTYKFNQDIGDWNISKVTDMSYALHGARVFNQDLSDWDTSIVTQMDGLFKGALVFNGNISTWDVSKVSNMDYMFHGANIFNQSLAEWDVSEVLTLAYMFYSVDDFDQNLSNWNVSKVSNMDYLFFGTDFNHDINSWDVSEVTQMNRLFASSNFNQKLNDWNVSNVGSMTNMFAYTVNFDQDLSEWDISTVTDMSNMMIGVNLSIANYDSLLIGWNNLPSLIDGVTFNAGYSQYSYVGNSSKENIIDNYNWVISDGGYTYFAPTWLYSLDNLTVLRDSGTTIHLSNLTDYAGGETITFSVQDENTNEVNCAIDSNSRINVTPAASWEGEASCTLGIYDGTNYGDNKSFYIIVENLTQKVYDRNPYFIFGTELNKNGSCSLWGNWSEWSIKETINVIKDQPINFTEITSLSFDTNYIWNVNCTDINDIETFGNNLTIEVDNYNYSICSPLSQEFQYTPSSLIGYNVTCNCFTYDDILVDNTTDCVFSLENPFWVNMSALFSVNATSPYFITKCNGVSLNTTPQNIYTINGGETKKINCTGSYINWPWNYTFNQNIIYTGAII